MGILLQPRTFLRSVLIICNSRWGCRIPEPLLISTSTCPLKVKHLPGSGTTFEIHTFESQPYFNVEACKLLRTPISTLKQASTNTISWLLWYLSISLSLSLYLSIYLSIFISLSLSLYIYTYIRIHAYIYIYIQYIYIYIQYISLSIYIYIHYIYIRVCIYIYI